MTNRDKNYRMSKQTKTMMAFAKTPEKRSIIKNMMINADIHGSQLPSKKDKKKVIANIEITE